MSTAAERAAWALYYHDNPATPTPFASAEGPIRALYLERGRTIMREALTMNEDELDEHAGDLMNVWGLEATDESGYDEAVRTVVRVVDSLLNKVVR